MSFEFAEYFTHYAADFAFGCVSFNSSQDERNQVGGFVFMASLFQSIQGFFNLGVVTGSFNFGDLFSLQFANGAVNAEQVLRRFFFLSELVDADDYATAGFNVHLPFVSGILDLFLDVALGDSFRSATDFINLVDVFPAFFFQFVGQSFYIVGAAQRVNGVSQAGFVSNAAEPVLRLWSSCAGTGCHP